jgi:PadR family transcriptional regulator AphA
MPVRHAMLGLLHWKPMHGYLLRKHAQEFSWIYPMSNTNVYPALHSLEQDGFVEHDSQIFDGRARKVYSITKSGTEELGRWLGDSEPPKVSFRDSLLLKISMMGNTTVPESRPWLHETIDQLRSEIESADRELKSREMGRYTYLVMEHGIDMMRQRLCFLEKVLDAGEVARVSQA